MYKIYVIYTKKEKNYNKYKMPGTIVPMYTNRYNVDLSILFLTRYALGIDADLQITMTSA